jgi:type II secretory pathway predicted ATPase ExeA
MYYAHFGLSEAPFRITPNTDVFFAGANRGAILDALIYAISQGEGIVKVTGEVGTGKTMICNMLQSRLPPAVETVYLAHPSVSPEEILHAIAFELQLKVPRDAGRMEVMQQLYTYLLERHSQGKQVVIFIEESQNMPIATLEEVRLLSNLETGKHKLLQIVLFGQPELDENLRQPNIRQLRERITHSFTLSPLAPPEVGEYLMFRLRAVGYRGPDLFSASVVKRIAQASAGLTRRVNLIADKALLAAFSDNTHTVQSKHVAAAISDSEFARDGIAADKKRIQQIAIGLLVLVAIGIAAYVGIRQFGARTATATPAPQDAQPSPQTGSTASAVATEKPLPPAATIGDARAVATTGSTAGVTPAPVPAVAPEQQQEPAQPPVQPLIVSNESQQPTDIKWDILEERIQAASRWLAAETPETLSIQLLAADNSQQLREHLRILAKSIEINNVFVYRTTVRQKPFLTVLYGSYTSRAAAQEALDGLSAQLKANKPYLRTVQAIREEVSRRNTL